MKRLLSLFIAVGVTVGFCLANVPSAMAQTPPDALKRVAVIGDSITEGYGTSSPSKRYTSLLDTTLRAQGRDGVANFGISGATALRWLNCPLNPTQQGCKQPDGSTPYAGQYDRLRNYQPTTVLIALGTNELVISRSASNYAS